MAFEADRHLTEQPGLTPLLAQSAEQIRTIARLARSVAGKTRLLSENVAVEAARLGPRGAGFASAAREAKKLSEDAAAAVSRIEALGRQSRSVAGGTACPSDEAGKLAALGSRQSEQVLAAFDLMLEALQGSIAEIGKVETELETLLRAIGSEG